MDIVKELQDLIEEIKKGKSEMKRLRCDREYIGRTMGEWAGEEQESIDEEISKSNIHYHSLLVKRRRVLKRLHHGSLFEIKFKGEEPREVILSSFDLKDIYRKTLDYSLTDSQILNMADFILFEQDDKEALMDMLEHMESYGIDHIRIKENKR